MRHFSTLHYPPLFSHLINKSTDIVAEGVEQQQVDTLNRLGVAVIQGYYFDRPLPKDDIDNRLKDPFYKIDRADA